MEIKNKRTLKIAFNKTRKNSNSVSPKMFFPMTWARDMGLSPDGDDKIIASYDSVNKTITIEKL